MKKLDFKKAWVHLYKPSEKTPSIIDVPRMKFLMIDGAGDPNTSQQFREAVQALYGVAYTIKFSYKKERKPKGFFDFVVPPLEGLWWMDGDGEFDQEKKAAWRWTLMIMQPEYVTKTKVKQATQTLQKRNGDAALPLIRFEAFKEGKCVQIFHRGSYANEGPNIAKMETFAKERNFSFCGKHHEIYMSDPRRVKPERWKTILRHPIEKKK